MNLNTRKNKFGELYIEVPVNFKLKIYLPEGKKLSDKITLEDYRKMVDRLERVDLGESVLTNLPAYEDLQTVLNKKKDDTN